MGSQSVRLYRSYIFENLNSKQSGTRGSCETGMRSAYFLPPAGARNFEANHRGIEKEHWAHCALVRRCKEGHILTERQSWCHRTIVESGW